MFTRKTTLLLTLAAVLGSGHLAGCREEEQGRIRQFEPGVYQGQADTDLDDAQVEELRQRARRQAGS